MSPWIIHRKPRRRRQVEERPVLQLPVAAPESPRRPKEVEEEESEKIERGVAVVDFYI